MRQYKKRRVFIIGMINLNCSYLDKITEGIGVSLKAKELPKVMIELNKTNEAIKNIF